MFILIWLIMYTIIFGTGVWYGKYILTNDLNRFDKALILFCILASLFLILVAVALLLGYSPMILTFC